MPALEYLDKLTRFYPPADWQTFKESAEKRSKMFHAERVYALEKRMGAMGRGFAYRRHDNN